MYEIETIIPLALVIGVLMGAGITWALLKNSASQVTERVSHCLLYTSPSPRDH